MHHDPGRQCHLNVDCDESERTVLILFDNNCFTRQLHAKALVCAHEALHAG